MAEHTEKINFYKLASIFVRPVPEALRVLLLKVVCGQFPGGKWSIIEFLKLMGKDTSKMPSMSPSEDVGKEWQKFLEKQKFKVYKDQVPHLLSDNCDEWDVTLLFCVLNKVNEVGKLSEDAGVFEGVQSLKNLRNFDYGHRSNDTATRDELEKVIRSVIENVEKLRPVLSETVEKIIKDVQDIDREELHFGSLHEKVIDEWKKERGRIQVWMEQMRDDVDCVKERVDEHDEKLHQMRERVDQHDEELRQGRERMNQRDEDPYQRRINQAPVPGPSNVHVCSNPKEVPTSHVRAKKVLDILNWRKLRNNVKDMLTKSRADTLEQHYKLIDSSCNAKIKSLLERGEPDGAATELIQHFKRNHSAVDLLQFCEFLRDEAKEAGRGAELENLANWIERAVKAQRPTGSS